MALTAINALIPRSALLMKIAGVHGGATRSKIES